MASAVEPAVDGGRRRPARALRAGHGRVRPAVAAAREIRRGPRRHRGRLCGTGAVPRRAWPPPRPPRPRLPRLRTGSSSSRSRSTAHWTTTPRAAPEIAYPNGRHPAAGGTGTYADPITAASDPRELPPGTLLYVPLLQAYLVMEDDCADCIEQWEHGRVAHVDVWGGMSGPGLLACEQALTPDAPVTLEVNPPPGRPTDPRPLCRAAAAGFRADPPGHGAAAPRSRSTSTVPRSPSTRTRSPSCSRGHRRVAGAHHGGDAELAGDDRTRARAARPVG